MSATRIAQPETTFSVVPASLEVGNTPHRVLVVGLLGAGGTAVAGKLVANILNDGSEKDLFGNSQLTDMIRHFKKINQVTTIDAIGIAEPAGGSAAAGSVTFDGTATAAGDYSLRIGGEEGEIKFSVAKGDTAEAAAGKLNAAITAKSAKFPLPVTAAQVTKVINLTAAQKGAQGNDIGLTIEGRVAGITITLAAMADGAGMPDTSTLFDVIGPNRYQTVIWPFYSDTDDVTDLLEARWNVKNNILDGQAITVSQDTFANQLAFVQGKNFKSLVYVCNGEIDEADHKGGMILERPENMAAQLGAIRALRYTEGAVLTPYLTTNAGLDQFGGPGIGALPYFNTLMPYLPTVPQGHGYEETEVEQLLAAGGSCMGNNQTGTNVILGELVTTYKTDPAGNEDPSFKFLNYVDEASIAREYFTNNVRKRFGQSRLTRGAIVPGRSMTNEGVVRSYLVGLYGDLSGPDYAILQAGNDQVKYFKENLRLSLNMVKGQITVLAKLCYVTQAREFIGTLEMAFDINGGQ